MSKTWRGIIPFVHLLNTHAHIIASLDSQVFTQSRLHENIIRILLCSTINQVQQCRLTAHRLLFTAVRVQIKLVLTGHTAWATLFIALCRKLVSLSFRPTSDLRSSRWVLLYLSTYRYRSSQTILVHIGLLATALVRYIYTAAAVSVCLVL